jgi:hypothetical protein
MSAVLQRRGADRAQSRWHPAISSQWRDLRPTATLDRLVNLETADLNHLAEVISGASEAMLAVGLPEEANQFGLIDAVIIRRARQGDQQA